MRVEVGPLLASAGLHAADCKICYDACLSHGYKLQQFRTARHLDAITLVNKCVVCDCSPFMAVRVALQAMELYKPVVSRTPLGPIDNSNAVSLAPEDAVAFTTGETQSTCKWQYGYDARTHLVRRANIEMLLSC